MLSKSNGVPLLLEHGSHRHYSPEGGKCTRNHLTRVVVLHLFDLSVWGPCWSLPLLALLHENVVYNAVARTATLHVLDLSPHELQSDAHAIRGEADPRSYPTNRLLGLIRDGAHKKSIPAHCHRISKEEIEVVEYDEGPWIRGSSAIALKPRRNFSCAAFGRHTIPEIRS